MEKITSLHHCKQQHKRDQLNAQISVISANKLHAHHETHLHTVKVVTILIPSLHGLRARQKFLGVYSLPFASVTREKKQRKKGKPGFLESRLLTASLSINQFSYFHMLFSHSAVPNFPIRSPKPRKLPRTWQNAVFEKQPFYIKLNLQKFSSSNYSL